MRSVFHYFTSPKFSKFLGIVLFFFISLSSHQLEAKSSKSKKTVSGTGLKYAAFVMDATSGKILHSDNSTALIPPASLTKMMTLHILFEELMAKRLTLNSPVLISKKAASQSPSKLGVPAGGVITVRDALLSLMTRSANDVAVAVAETVSGSEEAFVDRMNQRARSLKMTRTLFKNPSGLPNSQQVTSAYDMALLSRSLLQQFPVYYRFFKTKTFEYKGQKIHNHNKLLGKIEGLDGIKTGFVCASGFNIATSAIRQGRRLIGVVMGGETAKWRDRRISQLLETSFLKLPHQPMNNLVFESTQNAEIDLVQVATQPLNSQALPTQKAVYTPASLDQVTTSDTNVTQKVNQPLESGDWFVQLGTFKQAKDAHMEAAMIRSKLPHEYTAKIFVIKSDLKRARHYRARLGNFNKKSADKISNLLKKQGVSNLVLKDSSRAKIQTAMVDKK
ncbi:MAG: serine hydrolase [Janthinobacterium lividum]